MKRRTFFKGLVTLPFLKHLDLSLSTPVEAAPESWEMTLAEEGLLTGDGREIDWPDHNYNHWSSWNLDSGPINLGIQREPCFPTNNYVMFMEEWHRPVLDALPVIKAPRGGIRYYKPE